MIQINKTDLKTAIQWALGSRGIWTPEIERELIIEITNLALSQHDVSTRLFECIYYNHTGRVGQRCEIKARNMEEATTHFKFFYPKKLLWKINAL